MKNAFMKKRIIIVVMAACLATLILAGTVLAVGHSEKNDPVTQKNEEISENTTGQGKEEIVVKERNDKADPCVERKEENVKEAAAFEDETEAKAEQDVDNESSANDAGNTPYVSDETIPNEWLEEDSTNEGLEFDHTEQKLNGTTNDVYTDENGNEYIFDESGKEIGFLMNPEDVRTPEGMEDDGISEDDAVTIARELGMKEFPDEFPGMELTSVLKDEGNKTVSVKYEQRLGEKGFVTGMYFYAIINPDGTVFAYGLPNRDELAGFDVSLFGGLTESSVMAEIEAYERELHGDSLSRYETRSIKLKKDAEGFYVEVLVFGYSKTDFALIPGEDEMFDGGNTLRFDLD